jgi:TP901 family phage tail tape measure protein
MSVIRELAVKLGLDVDAASFAEGQLAAKAVEKSLELIVEAAKATIEFLYDVGKEAIETAGKLNDTSQAIGVTTDALQELQYAGGLAGISADEMTQSITILSKTMAKAKAGGEEQAKAFASIGVKVKDATGHLRPAEDVIGDIADHFKAMPDGAEKTAKSVELFGRAGARMISMLNEGGEGLAELRQEAHDLGLVMDEDTIKLGDDVGDNIDRIKGIFKAIKIQAGAALFPVLKRITTSVIEWVKANKELVRQKIADMVKGIARAAEILVKAVDVLWGSFKALYDLVVGTVVGGFHILRDIFESVGVAGRIAAIAFATYWLIATAPITAIVAGIAQVLLILNSIQRFREGRDSLFGDWMKMLDAWSKPSANDPWWLKAIKELVQYMEKALGIADRLRINAGGKPDASPGAPSTMPSGALGAGVRTSMMALDWLPRLGASKRFDERYENASASGASVWQSLGAGFGVGSFASMPQAASLPPGGGVMRAPIQQHNVANFVINPSQGMSEQDIADAITGRLETTYDNAAAALE